MENNNTDIVVSSEENVARILLQSWIVDDELQHTAFKLTTGETYISVNRPIIDTFNSDIATFIANHPDYQFDKDSYMCAMLNVGDVRGIKVTKDDIQMDINVEVESRGTHTKSHAGIFTRFHNKNVKNGQILKYGPTGEEISADTILLEVRNELLEIASLEKHTIHQCASR